jgi:hypothetical protein
MKKSVILAVAAVALLASTTGCAQPRYNNGYNGYNGYNRGYNNNNGWNYAAAAVGGAIVGGVVGAIINSNNQPQYAPAPVYAPQPVYVYPQACQTVRIPQYDQYGRLVQYVQMCAN